MYDLYQKLRTQRTSKVKFNPSLDIFKVLQVKEPEEVPCPEEDDLGAIIKPKTLEEYKANVRRATRHISKVPEVAKQHIKLIRETHDILIGIEEMKKK